MTLDRTAPHPEDDDLRTWHVHDDGTWAWGAVCEECIATPKGGDDKRVHFNIRHLQTQNREGWTVREKEQEIWDEAAKSGRDIEYLGNR